VTTIDPVVLVMAKAPRPGSVKTRLAPLLGDEGCAHLQSVMLRKTCELACAVAPTATFVAFDPPDAQTEITRHLPSEAILFPQSGNHLGARLADATLRVLADRPGPLVVIGTDIPLLSRSHLIDATVLLATGTDAVFGPAEDGGYYLVGLARHQPSLFSIDPDLWGGPAVLEATLSRVQAAGASVALLGRLRDLDTPADAMALRADPALHADLRQILDPRGQQLTLGASA
jgi:rSAM/selenodomain-associated transferase 1